MKTKHDAVLDALKAFLAHGENLNAVFYSRASGKKVVEAMRGQKELLQQARAAIREVDAA